MLKKSKINSHWTVTLFFKSTQLATLNLSWAFLLSNIVSYRFASPNYNTRNASPRRAGAPSSPPPRRGTHAVGTRITHTHTYIRTYMYVLHRRTLLKKKKLLRFFHSNHRAVKCFYARKSSRLTRRGTVPGARERAGRVLCSQGPG